MEVKPENTSRRGGVADYFTVLGVGERLIWQHTRKKSGVVSVDDEHDEEESEAELMERFYREIVEVAIVASDLESTSISQVPSFADDATVSSQTNSVSSVPTPTGKPKRNVHTPLSPPNSDVLTTITGTESISGRLSMRDLDGFTTIQNTCPAGRSSRRQDQGSVSSSGANESLSGSTVNESALWSKSQVFDANLDPCFGFRADVLAKVLQDSEHTPLKQLGRKVGSTIRQQLGPLLPSRERRSDRPSLGFRYHLAFRRRAPDEKDRPAMANVDLRYVKIHRDTVYLPRTKPIDVFGESLSTKSTSLRRGLVTGATIAARVAEASRQKFMEKYREHYEAPGRSNASQHHRGDGTDLESSDKILVALEDLIQIPDGFEQWSIPEPFRWIQIPSKVKDEPVRTTSSILGGRKTHVYSFNVGVYPGIDNVLSEDNTTQVSDPSGVGFEAYFTGSSFILTPPSSSAGASDIGNATHLSPRAAGVLVGPTDDHERTKSFEVLDPNAYMPVLLDVDNLPNLSNITSSDQYIYVPLLALRRQRVGNEERYHEDSAVVDMAVSFRDVSGDPVFPDVLGDDDDEDETFTLLNTTPWTCASRIAVSTPESNQVNRTLGSPVILVKRNQPIGFADAAFATSVLDRFPLKNYKGLPLPEEELPMFCYPTGCRLYRTKYSDCPLPQYFGFVVKNEQGDSIYVSCVSFMEPMTNAKTDQLNEISYRRRRVSIPHRRFSHRQARRNTEVQRQHLTVPICLGIGDIDDDDDLLQGFDEMTTFENKTICLVSRYPFWTAFRRFLSHLHTMSGSPSVLPVERYISHLLLSVPLPKPGGSCVLVPLPALNCPMVLSLPSSKDLPLVDLPFQTLFACLDVPTVVTIVIGLLSLERKLLVISTRPSLLLDVCELLKALLFPFELCAPYVPRLTEPFMSCLEFPGAIFVGIHDDGRRDGLAATVRKSLPEDSAIVDLDTGAVDCSGDRYEVLKAVWRIIPPGPRSMLVSEIETLCRDAGIVPGQEPLDSQVDAAFDASVATANLVEDINDGGHAHREPLDDRAVRDSFLRFFTSVLAGYERFLVPPDLDFKTSGSEWFDTQGFLSAASQEQAPYLGSLVATQLFQLFIQRRTEASDVHCLLFDECLVEYHSSPIPYGRLGGDVETVPSMVDGPPQMLYSLLVDQCCADSQQVPRGGSFDHEGDPSDVVPSTSETDLRSPDLYVNEYGDVVTSPTRIGISETSRFVYFSDGNPCFPQKLNTEYFYPAEPDSLLVEISKTTLPLLTRTEREVEEALRRRKVATSYRGLRNHSRCLWQLPKLMGSHFLGSWLLCIPAQVSQKGISPDNQSRYLLRALGAMRLLRNKQRIIPDEASYRAMIVVCGCVSTDRRVELGKLFGLLRGDGIFPSAVTLGQYTRALAEGYSKRAIGLKDESTAAGVEVTVAANGQKAVRSEYQRRRDEELTLNTLDGDIAVLEESGRRWRSRPSHSREWEQNESSGADVLPKNEVGGSSSVSSKPRRKQGSTVRPWHPVVISSSFVPPCDTQSPLSDDLRKRFTLVALWSRTTACEGCSYVPLDEEIQSGWDVIGQEGEWQSMIACPRCDAAFAPQLAYREMDMEEVSRLEVDGNTRVGENAEIIPGQINPSLDSADENYVGYISPSDLRSRLERLVEEHGESVLDREVLRTLDPEVFFNLWWYCCRFSMPLPLPIDSCRIATKTSVPHHKCAFAAWERSTALHGCRAAGEVISRVFADVRHQSRDYHNRGDRGVFDEDVPFLSQFKLQNFSKGDWDHEDLSKVLVSLVEACDKRDFKPVVECALRCIKRRSDLCRRSPPTEIHAELDCYRTILYLAKYQCTTAFHVFFPATAKPCKGYHFWCAFGTPLPIFDRLFRDAVKRIKEHGNLITPIHDVGDVALGFRCVFGHII